MLPLRCSAQNYEWGRPATQSEVAQLAKANGSNIDESKPFAELWMGTHPNCPSYTCLGNTLEEWIQNNPLCLGIKAPKRFGRCLPFLFKVLSVNKALSIQSHPDKKLAEKLHREHPKLYADDNHKPEMALAITDFEALCGFLCDKELEQVLGTTPELRQCIGEPLVKAYLSAGADRKQALRAMFTALMTCNPETVTKSIQQLVARLTAESQSRRLTAKEQLALRLDQQYPGGDVGVFSSFFLNLITLKPGQAVYLAANEPHAYLSGELMECMATSDNVIRAGLTPKFKHTEVLCQSLTYEQGQPDVLQGTPVQEGVQVYRPPFEEFEIQGVNVASSSTVQLPANDGPQMVLVMRGSGTATARPSMKAEGLLEKTQLHRGMVLFVPAGTQISVAATEPLSLWTAACNANLFKLYDALADSPKVPVSPHAATKTVEVRAF